MCVIAISFNEKHLSSFISEEDFSSISEEVLSAAALLDSGKGPGNDFLGWRSLPTSFDPEEFFRIITAAKKIRDDSDILIVIGIGGSYLGARSAIEFLQSPNYNYFPSRGPQIFFAGCNLSGSYLQELLDLFEGKRISLNVVSKSGTTTEPALAFRVLRNLMISRYGSDAKNRIYCTTDKSKGTLKELADQEGYETFVIPDDVGGRYSVLTAVGLLPIAVAGCDLSKIMRGALDASRELSSGIFATNPCYRYVAARNILLRKGYFIESFINYEPRLVQFSEWLKQLFGESEGKNHKGLFPTSAAFTTDLHSMGQYFQDGQRIMFETVLDLQKAGKSLFIQNDPADLDGLNFLSDQNMELINRSALEGTVLAHTEGGVPNLILEIPDITEYDYGYMVYFFERACAISGYLLGVNPFDQPGVEAYKKNMFALLGKPGYEETRKSLLAKLH